MPILEIKDYSDERLLNTIKQSYNFSKEVVKDVSKEALKREIISKLQLKELLKKDQVERKNKEERNYQNKKNLHMGKIDARSEGLQKWVFITIIGCIGSLVLWYFTGWIFAFVLAPTAFIGGKFLSK